MPCSPDGLREVAGMGLAVASSYQAVYNYSTNLMSGSPKAVEICAKVLSMNIFNVCIIVRGKLYFRYDEKISDNY